MHDEKPPLTALRLLAGIGTTLALIGTIWLGLLAFQRLWPGTELVASDRAISLLPEEPAADSTSPAPATAVPSADTTTAESDDASGSTVDPGGDSAGYAPDDPQSSATSQVTLTPRLLIDSDLGTGSSEFSGVALNEQHDRLLIADDAGLLFEFDLDSAGLPVTPARRTIRVTVGGGDIEGVSWIAENTYVLAHEDDGKLTVVEIDDDLTVIGAEHVTRTIDTLIREENGNGLEGVAFVATTAKLEFVVVDERPPTVFGISPTGTVDVLLAGGLDVTDLSDIAVAPDGTFTAVSDEGRSVINFRVGPAGEVEILETTSLVLRAGRFEQPEGLALSRDGDRLYVVGEAPGPGQFSFGFWSRN